MSLDSKRKLDPITKIDTNADGNKYIGTADAGSDASDPVWYITRIDGANPQTIDGAINVAWDNRTTETYA